MLNFDEDRFLRIESGAVAAGVQLREVTATLLNAGASNVFFLGAGGAGVLMQPAAQLLDRLGPLPTRVVHAAEILAVPWPALGPKSIVVVPSLSGTTPEAVAVLKYAKALGASTITLTGHADSPVAELADHNVTNFAEDDTSSESFYVQSLLFALAVLEHEKVFTELDRVIRELETLPRLLLDVKRAFEDRAAELAEQFKDIDYHIITGAGGAWTEAWYYGTCILEEMQWIKTRPIHAADFFHGTLELLEEDTSLIILKGEDESRELVDRVEAWAPKVSHRVTVLDSAEFELAGLSKDVRAMISPAVLATMLERLSAHLEVLRDHPLTTRRYYRRMEY